MCKKFEMPKDIVKVKVAFEIEAVNGEDYLDKLSEATANLPEGVTFIGITDEIGMPADWIGDEEGQIDASTKTIDPNFNPKCEC